MVVIWKKNTSYRAPSNEIHPLQLPVVKELDRLLVLHSCRIYFCFFRGNWKTSTIFASLRIPHEASALLFLQKRDPDIAQLSEMAFELLLIPGKLHFSSDPDVRIKKKYPSLFPFLLFLGHL